MMESLYDVIVVGGGPAGLTAAIYLARAKYRVLVVEKDYFGGQVAITQDVDNYPGTGRISGWDLAQAMHDQAEAFGAEFLLSQVTGLELSREIKTVFCGGENLHCRSVLLATGAHPRMAGFRGEDMFKGRGVSYCATCDAPFFLGKDVFVIGGGYSAAQESVYLAKFARHVTILIRKDDFSCAASVADAARSNPKITVLTNTVMESVSGDGGLTHARYRNVKTGKVRDYTPEPGGFFGVFVFAGYIPSTDFLKGIVDLDDHGYILTDMEGKTSMPGVYAAGDVRVKPLRQVVTAASDGAVAALELEKYLTFFLRTSEKQSGNG